METIADISALLTAALNGIAALAGAWVWWRVTPERWVWALIRVGQGAAALLAAVAGVAWFSGARPDEGLFWLYALLPVGIGFFAEQFRILAAQTVLEQRDLEDAAAVGNLPEAQQRSVVIQIMRRELGVMALAAGVIAFLALRVLAEAPGL